MFKYAKEVLKKEKGKRSEVVLPIKARLTKWTQAAIQLFQAYFVLIETTFHITALFTLFVFMGMPKTFLTFLGAVAAYFLWQEFKTDLRFILSAMKK